MRFLVQGASGRRISWSLVVTLLLPIVLLAFSPRKAQAQLSRVPQVAVIDFENLTSNQTGGILGRQATDAVVVEMTRTGRYDVTPRTQLNQQLQEMGLSTPLNNVAIQKLGQALGVDYVATGAITDIRFLENPRRAQATVRVLLTDVASGDLANGAIRSGISPAPPPGFQPDDDTLITQAISDAAFNAVTQTANYALPEATILATRGKDEVMLNRGARDGISSGLEMNILRGSLRVGRIRVTDVSDTSSIAHIVENNSGIRPEDRARAVVKVPGYNINPDTGEIKQFPVREAAGGQKKRGKNIIGTVLGVLAAVALVAFLTRSKSSTQSSGAGKVTARAFSDLGTAGNDATSGRVLVTWDYGSDIPVNYIQEVQIFRDNVIIAAQLANQRQFIDDPNLTGEFDYTDVDFNGNAVARTATATPLTVGVQHRYSVSIVYREIPLEDPDNNDNGNGNNDDNDQDLERDLRRSPLSGPSGQATPVARPEAITPNRTQQDLDGVVFTFQTVQGANQYVIELSDDPTGAFRNKKTLGPLSFPYSPSSPSTTASFNIRALFPTAVAGTSIYWRVGARNSADSPGPSSQGVPNGSDFIYTAQNTTPVFEVLDSPPGPP